MSKKEILGFDWNESSVPTNVSIHSKERAAFRFYKMLPDFVWDASMLEGNPFTYPQVKTIMDGITVGGHKISDQEQVLNLVASSKLLLELVRSNRFDLEIKTSASLHALVARNEALEWGHFRGQGSEGNYTPDVGLGAHGKYTPMPTQPGGLNLQQKYLEGKSEIESIENPLERGIAVFLFGALQQFYFDGNKRTSRMMMNGSLMKEGIDAISIPAARSEEFNEKMVDFFRFKQADEMMTFMVSCHPDWAPSAQPAIVSTLRDQSKKARPPDSGP